MDPRAKEKIRAWERGNSNRSNTLSHWQEITRYMVPDRASYTTTITPGQKTMQWVFDATPIWCVVQFAAGLHSLLTSPTLKWFGLKADDDALDSVPEVRAWLDKVTANLYGILNSPKRNFATQSQELWLDLGSIGGGAMAILEGRQTDIFFSTRHMKECVIEENDEDRVDVMRRRFEFTAKQATERWGARAGEKAVKAMADGKEDQIFAYHHSVEPRRQRDPQRSDAKHKPFESCYVAEADQELVSEGGFDEFPYITPRLSKVSGEINGRGCGSWALPDVKMLQEMTKLVLQAAQLSVKPPMQLPDNGFLVPIKSTPGALNFYRSGTRPTDRIETIKMGGDIALGIELINRVETHIMRTFYVDLMRMPMDLANPVSDGKGSTATYWLQRREKEMMALSPMLARVSAEGLDPAIGRVFAIQWRRSKRLGFGPGSPFPPPPPQLSGVPLHVEYVSPIAIAQKSSALDNTRRLIEQQLLLRQINPESRIFLNEEAIMRLTARDLNTPVDALKSAEQIEAELEADAEAQAALIGAQGMESAAGAAKDGSAALKNLADAGGGRERARAA